MKNICWNKGHPKKKQKQNQKSPFERWRPYCLFISSSFNGAEWSPWYVQFNMRFTFLIAERFVQIMKADSKRMINVAIADSSQMK